MFVRILFKEKAHFPADDGYGSFPSQKVKAAIFDRPLLSPDVKLRLVALLNPRDCDIKMRWHP